MTNAQRTILVSLVGRLHRAKELLALVRMDMKVHLNQATAAPFVVAADVELDCTLRNVHRALAEME